jgi:hypothetical protein
MGWMLGGQATAKMLNRENDRGKSVKDVARWEAKRLVQKFGGESGAPPMYDWRATWWHEEHSHSCKRRWHRVLEECDEDQELIRLYKTLYQ